MGTWQRQSERTWTVILNKPSKGQAQCEVLTHTHTHMILAKQEAEGVKLCETYS